LSGRFPNTTKIPNFLHFVKSIFLCTREIESITFPDICQVFRFAYAIARPRAYAKLFLKPLKPRVRPPAHARDCPSHSHTCHT
jgi:hypothetical protein